MKDNKSVKEISLKPSLKEKKIPLQLSNAKFIILKERIILVVLSNKNIYVKFCIIFFLKQYILIFSFTMKTGQIYYFVIL